MPGFPWHIPHAMSPEAKQLMHFEGGNALSEFRAKALLPRLQGVQARITGVARIWMMAVA